MSPLGELSEEGANKSTDIPVDRQIELKIQEWDIVIRTQMHFNEMIMKTRTLGMTAVVGLLSASAAATQYSRQISLGIAFFALVLLAGVFILDYCYYYKMLLGSVDKGYQIDDGFKEMKIAGSRMFGMSHMIRDRIGPKGRSKYYMWAYYGVVASTGGILMAIVGLSN